MRGSCERYRARTRISFTDAIKPRVNFSRLTHTRAPIELISTFFSPAKSAHRRFEKRRYCITTMTLFNLRLPFLSSKSRGDNFNRSSNGRRRNKESLHVRPCYGRRAANEALMSHYRSSKDHKCARCMQKTRPRVKGTRPEKDPNKHARHEANFDVTCAHALSIKSVAR